MVVSRLDRTLSYPETRSIFPADKDLEVDLYSIFVKGVEVVVAVGSAAHTYISKHIVYHPIYMIKSNSKAMQIGVYEIKSADVLSVTDEEGAIILDQIGEPLVYTFATKKMIMDQRMVPPTASDEEDEKEQEDTQYDVTVPMANGTIPALRADIFTFDASTVSTSRSIATTFEETQKIAEENAAKFEKPP
jgi:hypothetical protein